MSDDIEPATFVSRQSDVGKGSGLNGKLPIVSVNADVVDGDVVSEKSCLDLEKGNRMLEVGGGTPELNRCASASKRKLVEPADVFTTRQQVNHSSLRVCFHFLYHDILLLDNHIRSCVLRFSENGR